MDPDFWQLAKALLSREQVSRLRRMDQRFSVLALCTDDPLHVIFTGSGMFQYDMIYTGGRLHCTCPDAIMCPEFRCKHQCWMIVLMGGGGVAAIQGDRQDLDKAMKAAGVAITELLLRSAGKHMASKDKMEDDFPICYEPLRDTEECCKCSDCSSHFHFSCLATWLVNHSASCPLCRGKDWDDL